ncbi:CRINKLY4 related 3 [Artemisia annua]|uniref:non-specific serine/threonine protein kinase n=1 Tax=Artemisia annua TaxID=35608 RepID=A0A2U1N598_ARTAN|nr:CRINKLY4 related 3 [Artemisia annua]
MCLSLIKGSRVSLREKIVSSQPSQRVQCWRNGQVFDVFSNISFEAISGGHDVFCGVRSGGSALVCWNPSLVPKRIYYNETFVLKELAVGDSQICAITNSTSGTNVLCWRNGGNEVLDDNTRLGAVSSGLGFSCGVGINSTNGIICFGEDLERVRFIESEFNDFRMLDIVVGGDHACGVNSTGFLICRGGNDYGQVNVPDHTSFEFSALALGVNHTCALRRVNSTVVCWGGVRRGMMSDYVVGVSFESIVAGLDFTCGLTTSNLSVICWGEGWVNNGSFPLGYELPLRRILPGPCVRTVCACGIYSQSDILCSGYGTICRPCDIVFLSPPNVGSLAPPLPDGGDNDNGGTPTSLVDFAVQAIISGDLAKILDKRVGPPEVNESEAVELMAYTAIHCVNLEGRERPTMTDIVANLERAVSICDDSHGSISSGQISIISD